MSSRVRPLRTRGQAPPTGEQSSAEKMRHRDEDPQCHGSAALSHQRQQAVPQPVGRVLDATVVVTKLRARLRIGAALPGRGGAV